MANYNQIASTHVCDLPFKNFGVSDIPANSAVLLDTAHDFGVVLPTASGGVAGTIGVTVDTIKAGYAGRVRVLGTMSMIANGTITRGDTVQASDTTSKLGWAKTRADATVDRLGKALNSAANGDPVLVFIAV